MIIEKILSLLPILTNFDILLNKEIINLWNPLITKLMILISYLFDPLVIIILSIIIAIIIYKKQPINLKLGGQKMDQKYIEQKIA